MNTAGEDTMKRRSSAMASRLRSIMAHDLPGEERSPIAAGATVEKLAGDFQRRESVNRDTTDRPTGWRQTVVDVLAPNGQPDPNG